MGGSARGPGRADPLHGCEPVTVNKFYFKPAPARARVNGMRAEHPFPLFFSLKLSKIQKNNIKHGSGPHEGRARSAGRGQNPEISSPARPVIFPSSRAELVNKLSLAHT